MSRTQVSLGLPRPGKALGAVMIGTTCIWVMFAVAINWAGGGQDLFAWLAGDSEAVLGGQIWRLLTAALIHDPRSPGHLLISLMLLYFLGAPLEQRWGPWRMLGFLAASAAVAFATQVLVGAIVPSLGSPAWYGALGVGEAVAVAWAMGARGQVVRLFFLVPVTPMLMVAFIFVMSVLAVFARTATPEGLVTPFGGMLAGWALSEGSPLRRLYLRLRLRRLQLEMAAMQRLRARQAESRRRELRVIPGGRSEHEDEPPPDKGMLH
ncbi:MAG: rhomboid family intramembrane serine protease [Deltaproteobacteria bacterium]|nr:rhomboid family intramembrane serine protease [Deltaproteobacteria bacterium]